MKVWLTLIVVAIGVVVSSGGCVRAQLGVDRKDVRVRGALPGDVPELLASADRFVIYAIDPNDYEEPIGDVPINGRGTAEDPRMCGYRIVGSREIDDERDKLAITKDLMRAIVSQKPGAIFCFMPQHAIHAALDNGDDVDVLICYACEEVRVYSSWGRTWSDIERVGRSRLDQLLAE